MCSLFLGSGVNVNGSHSYSGPPRGPDEVFDSLRRAASCGVQGSFLDAVQCGRRCKVEQWLTLASSLFYRFLRMDRGNADDDFFNAGGLNR